MSSLFTRNLKRQYAVIDSANGSWLQDSAGNKYLDGCSGAVCANLGHGLPEVKAALEAQLGRVAFAHTSQFVSESAQILSASLVEMAGTRFVGGKVYFAGGGSEAVETALKLARAYCVEADPQTRKTVFISRRNSYHGSTFGALSVTGHPARTSPYQEMLVSQPKISPSYPYRCVCGAPDQCARTECGIAAAMELQTEIEQIGAERVVAFIAEPIVGAALGAVAPHASYWAKIREICTKYNILLIADEVMTGLGRCGSNLALERWGVCADIVVLGKGLAAGYMPLSAVLASADVVAPFLSEQSSGAFEHGFTYSGHPLSCAAGVAVNNYLRTNRVVESVAARADEFRARLELMREHEFVGDVRCTGFLGGLEFVANRKTKEPFPKELRLHRVIADTAWDAGLLLYPGAAFLPGGRGDHVMVAPPLNISDADMDVLFSKLEKVFKAVGKQLTAACH